jgi:hypothetical protein
MNAKSLLCLPVVTSNRIISHAYLMGIVLQYISTYALMVDLVLLSGERVHFAYTCGIMLDSAARVKES